jgi:hypothetical protein
MHHWARHNGSAEHFYIHNSNRMYRMRATNKVVLTLILAILVVINIYSLGYVIVNKALAKRQSVDLREPGVFQIGFGVETSLIEHLTTLAHQEEHRLLKHVEPISPLDMNGASTFEIPGR